MAERIWVNNITRDRTPELDSAQGIQRRYGRASSQQALVELIAFGMSDRTKKLQKDAVVHGIHSREEILNGAADLLELVRALGNSLGIEFHEILNRANTRRDIEGGYDQGTAVIEQVEVRKDE